MADAFEVLRRDHDEVRRMLFELAAGPTAATGATEPQLEARKKLAEKLIITESRHEAIEADYFWPVVRGKLPEGDRLADEATRQEQDAEEMLDKVGKLDASEPGFEELIATFIAAAREHMTFEETRVWPEIRAVLTAYQCNELGEKLEGGKDTAPTRPHPNIPPEPGILKSAGPAVAAADKVRDAVTGRGRE